VELYSEIWGILTSVYRCFSGADNAIPHCNDAWEEVSYKATGLMFGIGGIIFFWQIYFADEGKLSILSKMLFRKV